MSGTAGLIQRNGRYYFNRAWPKELWPVTGKAPFRRSLKTTDLQQARRARVEAERLFFEEVDKARAKLATLGPQKPALTHTTAEALAAAWFRDWLADAEEMRTPPTGWDYINRRIKDAEDSRDHARHRLRMRRFDHLREGALRMVNAAGYTTDEGASFHHLLAMMGRADVAANEVYIDRLGGDYGTRPSDPFFASAMVAAPTFTGGSVKVQTSALSEAAPPGHTVEDLEAAYRKHKLDHRAPSTQTSYAPVFRLLRDIFGPRKEVAKVTRADARRVFEAIQELPTQIGKNPALIGLTVPEAIKEGKRLGLPRLTATSINGNYMAFLSAIFKWAKREGWIATNPFEGLTVEDTSVAQEKRDAFSDAQLNTIFAAEPWSPPDLSKPIRYWAPLIALFLGMRRGEIAQIKTKDIDVVETFPVIRVRGARLKTDNARRTLPVHQKLIDLGFLTYVEERRQAGGGMLFEGEAPNSRGQWGDPLSDWFNRRLTKLGIAGTKLGMHSFRHNFEDRLREAGLHGTPLGAALAGRTKGTDAEAYGSGFSTRTLAEAVAKIAYPDLILTSSGNPEKPVGN